MYHLTRARKRARQLHSRNPIRLGDTAIVTVARFAVTLSAAIGLFTSIAAYAQTGAACDKWNTEEFFKAGNVADVDRCLKSGADPKCPDRERP